MNKGDRVRIKGTSQTGIIEQIVIKFGETSNTKSKVDYYHVRMENNSLLIYDFTELKKI